jgi:hypothetical protein
MTITNARDEKVQVTIHFDFSGSSDAEIKSWLAGNRAIAFQRPSRALSASEIMSLDGSVVQASQAGQKVKSRSERIAELTAVGIPAQLAELAVDNPEAFAKAMENMSKAE